MSRQRRLQKPTPLNELLFLLVVAAGLLIIVAQLELSIRNLTGVFGIFLLLAMLVGTGLYLFFLWKQQALHKAFHAVELSQIDEMSGLEFEKYVATLLGSRGYRTQLTPVNDYGVDIIATKGGVKTAVQVKRYSSKLDQKPVREAIAGKSVRKYGCTEAMVVTNSTFTKAAKFLAAESGCILADRQVLGEWILESKNYSKGYL